MQAQFKLRLWSILLLFCAAQMGSAQTPSLDLNRYSDEYSSGFTEGAGVFDALEARTSTIPEAVSSSLAYHPAGSIEAKDNPFSESHYSDAHLSRSANRINTPVMPGCTVPGACNYDPSATPVDNSMFYTENFDGAAASFDPSAPLAPTNSYFTSGVVSMTSGTWSVVDNIGFILEGVTGLPNSNTLVAHPAYGWTSESCTLTFSEPVNNLSWEMTGVGEVTVGIHYEGGFALHTYTNQGDQSQIVFPFESNITALEFEQEYVTLIDNLQFATGSVESLCVFPGCTDATACNYNSLAGCDDGSCEYTSCQGCTDATACNYDPSKSQDDGSCDFTSCYGCMRVYACNYDPAATRDSGTCDFGSCTGCTDNLFCNYDPLATQSIQGINFKEHLDSQPAPEAFADQLPGNTNGYFTSPYLTVTGGTWEVIDISTINWPGLSSPNALLGNTGFGNTTDNATLTFSMPAQQVAFTVAGPCDVVVDVTSDAGSTSQTVWAGGIYGTRVVLSEAGVTQVTLTFSTPGIAVSNIALDDIEYTVVNETCSGEQGCTDPAACNYEPEAGCDDGFSCEYPGCTDAASCNYSASAGCDDGSCCLANCVDFVMFNFGGLDITYAITNQLTGEQWFGNNQTDPGAISEEDFLCLEDGCYSLEVSVQNEDGVNDAWALSGPEDLFIVGQTDDTIEFVLGPGFCDNPNACNYQPGVFCVDNSTCEFPGCSDPAACNYAPNPNCAQENCCYGTCATLTIPEDPAGPVFEGDVSLSVQTQDFSYEEFFFVNICEDCLPRTISMCLPADCFLLSIGQNLGDYFSDLWPGFTLEVDGEVVVSETEVTQDYTFTTPGFSGCTLPGACNYNPGTWCEDNSTCQFPGCSDPAACNYAPNPDCAEENCCYENCATLTFPEDPGVSFESIFSVSLNNPDFSYFEVPFIDVCPGCLPRVISFCLPPDCYSLEISASMNGVFSDQWPGYSFELDGEVLLSGTEVDGLFQFTTSDYSTCNDPVACNYNADAECVDNSTCAYPGCNDPLALNYDSAAGCDDGSCTYAIPGCTSVSACNYDPAATENDGSCEFPGCTNPFASNYSPSAGCDDGSCCFGQFLEVNLEYNISGFNDMTFTLTNDYFGNIVIFDTNATFNNGEDYCIGSACYTFDIVCQQFDANWSVRLNGVTVGSGTGSGSFSFTAGTGAPGIGCTASLACNYDPDAICDDGSCEFGGCTDVNACNYDPAVTCDNSTCIYPGCTDASACNYDGSAGCDDGSCTYPGCTDASACNFDPSASCDDGFCTYPGCTDASACNYNATAGCNDGSCTYPGCTDATACNYDASASCDDGSCTYPGCMDPFACNYDPSAVCDDFSCTYPGCTDVAACNFDPSAACDDGSCLAAGCTDAGACNYDAAASCEDGSCCYENCIALQLINTAFPDVPVFIDYTLTNQATGEVLSGANQQSGGAQDDVTLCVADGCYTFAVTVSGGNGSLSWNLSAPGTFQAGSTSTSFDLQFGPGYCTDPAAINYLPGVTCSDNSLCQYAGCTDASACNYDASAGVDDGSCCYQNCITLQLNNETAPGVPVNISYTITNQLSGAEVTGSNQQSGTSLDVVTMCLEDGCYTIDVVADGTSGLLWTIEQSGVFFELFGASASYDFQLGAGYCTDPTAVNYTSGVTCTDNSLCQYVGCTDATACNYDATAAADDGSCCYQNCITLQLNNETAPGVPVNINYTITNQLSGAEVTGSNQQSGTSLDVVTVCLEDGCYTIDVVADGTSGLLWTIEQSGVFFELFGASASYDFQLGAGYCTDPSAVNYTAGVTCTDNSLCLYAGCTDATACNYDATAAADDGSCCYQNCLEVQLNNLSAPGVPVSLNYVLTNQVTGETFTGSNQQSGEDLDELTLCLPDGCYTWEVISSDFATLLWSISGPDGLFELGASAGSVDFQLGAGYCTDPTAANYTAGVTCSDNTLCLYAACTDMAACNYTPDADVSDNTLCTYPGCLYPFAMNYDVNAGCEDGSCVFAMPGCTDPSACNYQALANTDDGSCTYPGCTYSEADNYDPAAACDDGSCVLNVSSSCPTDLSGDGLVSAPDLLILLAEFGSACP